MASSRDNQAAVLSHHQNVAVIGAGVIGSSWTAFFLAHGLEVVVNDPRPDIDDVVKGDLQKIAPSLRALGLPTNDLARHLRFEPDLERAVTGADVIQENGPERIEFKQELWVRVERAAPRHALLLSSSSARPATEQGRDMKDASRLLVGHPFNPPHLIPPVEVVPGERTDPKAVEEAVAFYEALGKVPRTLRSKACAPLDEYVPCRDQRRSQTDRGCGHRTRRGHRQHDAAALRSGLRRRWSAFHLP